LSIRRFCFVEGAPIKSVNGRAATFSWAKQLIEDTVRWFPQTRVICPSSNGHAALERELVDLENQWLEVTALPAPPGRLRRYLMQIPTLWKMVGEADLVCVDIPNESGFLAALICGIRRKPLVTQILGEWELASRIGKPRGFSTWVKSKAAKMMTVATVRCSRLIFTQGNNLYVQLKRHNQGAFKASMVHSTLTDGSFYLREWKSYHSPVRLLSVGGLVPLKRADIVLDALLILKSLGVAVEWWCVGDGSERSRLERTAKRLGIDTLVRFCGYVPLGSSLFSLYRQTDIFVHPSMSEGVPHALLEAMANSLPVVTTSAGGIPGVVRDGVEAIIVPPGNAQILAAAVMRLIRDPELAQRMSRAACLRAREFHSEILSKRRRELIEASFGKIAA
jgi:glycosyltransferase involved in cell wall biosynthesis